MLRLTLLLTLIWLPSFIADHENLSNLFILRKHFIIYTGILLLSYVFAATLLSTRFRWVEKIVKGLDKGYQLHKKFGIAAGITLLVHWSLVNGGNVLIAQGLIPPPPPMPSNLPAFIKVALTFGEYSFYAMGLMLLVGLVQAISYKNFQIIHKWAGFAVIMGVSHGFVFAFLNFTKGTLNPAIFAAIVSMVLSAIAISLLSIFGLIGRKNKVKGKVSKVERFNSAKGLDVVRFSISLNAKLKYKEGQFAYLNFYDEAPHPFSILHYDETTNVIEFGVKSLGDYTEKLVRNLAVGQEVTVEGGYGHFQNSNKEKQIWVGAGIGIVPILSRLHALKLKDKKEQHNIDIFYSVASKQEAYFYPELSKLASEKKVNLHLMNAEKGQLLNSEQIAKMVDDLDMELSFCGPYAFGEALKSGLIAKGFDAKNFRSELFKMR